MRDPRFGAHSATMFMCGGDPAAKAVVKQLSDAMGFETADAGLLVVARLLESLAMLGIHLPFGMKWGTDFAFKVLKR